jgi:hypothetical protein
MSPSHSKRVKKALRKDSGSNMGPVSQTTKSGNIHAERFDVLATVLEDLTVVYQISSFCAQPNPAVVELTKDNEQYSWATPNCYRKAG